MKWLILTVYILQNLENSELAGDQFLDNMPFCHSTIKVNKRHTYPCLFEMYISTGLECEYMMLQKKKKKRKFTNPRSMQCKTITEIATSLKLNPEHTTFPERLTPSS
jgi:hypothetical protein